MSQSPNIIYKTITPAIWSDMPIVLANDVKGGIHQVNTLVELESIPVKRLKTGFLVNVIDADGNNTYKTYQYIGDGNSNNFPSDWNEIMIINAWRSGMNYQKGRLVMHNNQYWVCNADHVSNTSFDAAEEAFFVNISQKIWISDTSVSGEESWDLFFLSDGATPRHDSAAFVIQDNGRVGIGTSKPIALLDVAGNISQSNTGNSVFLGQNAGIVDDLNDNRNVFVGYNTGLENVSGNRNVAVGARSLYHNTNGSGNTAIGFASLRENITGNGNTIVGFRALVQNIAGSYNVAYGYEAGKLTTDGLNNMESNNSIYIGYDTRSSASGNINEIVIGSEARGEGSNTIRLGNTSITNIYAQVKISTNSDRRFKKNIRNLDLGLNFITKIEPVSYVRKNDENEDVEFGFIAQDLKQTLIDLGYENSGMVNGEESETGHLSVRHTDLIAPLVKSIKELNSQNDTLKLLNVLLKEKLNELILRVKKLENE